MYKERNRFGFFNESRILKRPYRGKQGSIKRLLNRPIFPTFALTQFERYTIIKKLN